MCKKKNLIHFSFHNIFRHIVFHFFFLSWNSIGFLLIASLINSTVITAKWIEIVKPIGCNQIEPVTPSLLGKGGKSIRTGREVPSIAVGTCPDNVKQQITFRLLRILALRYGNGTSANGLLGFFFRRQSAVEPVRVVLALLGGAKDASVVPRDSGHDAFIDGNDRRQMWIDFVIATVV
jgi:hypothetical protein